MKSAIYLLMLVGLYYQQEEENEAQELSTGFKVIDFDPEAEDVFRICRLNDCSLLEFTGEQEEAAKNYYGRPKTLYSNYHIVNYGQVNIFNSGGRFYSKSRSHKKARGHSHSKKRHSPGHGRRLQQADEEVEEDQVACVEEVFEVPACCEEYFVHEESELICDIAAKYDLDCALVKEFNGVEEEVQKLPKDATLQIC
eukprot:TRINITY_DN29976_c0_g1_i1.p2 TRINITY_DN29976_c0_g1~~TRINITY_DN29976_c0_g1_i1.p2  ORF type:complete len:197 (-),score=32.83 TRINITY_DN29976_c0_g1_i1:353-943(-)